MAGVPMLDLFRKRGLTSVVYGAIIIATILVFVIGFRPSSGQKLGSIKQECVAEVHGTCIDPKTQRAAYRLLIPRGNSGELLTARAEGMGLGKTSLDGLIERELLIGEAQRLGLSVSDDEVTDSIFGGFILVSVPSDNPQLAYTLGVRDGRINPALYGAFRDPKTKQFDTKVYERIVRAMTGRSPTDFREWQQRELLAARMRDVVRAPVRISEDEAWERFADEKSTAALNYVPVRASYMEKYAVTATDKEVEDWAKDATNAATVEGATIRHVLLKVGKDAKPEEKAAAKAKLEKAIERIKKGEAFADVAREVSQDPGSAVRGGDVGTKTDGFVEPFKKAADALKPTEMSPIVETQFGFHVIKKDDDVKEKRKKAYLKAKSLEAAKDLAVKILADIKAGKVPDEVTKAAIQPLVKEVKAPAAPAAPAAATGSKDAGADGSTGDAGAPPAEKPKTADTDQERPQLLTGSSFNRQGSPIPGLSPDDEAKVRAFGFEGKAGAIMPEPLRVDDGFMIVLVREQKAITRAEFDKERDSYMANLLAAKQAEALALYVRRLRESSKDAIKTNMDLLVGQKRKTDGGAAAPAEDDDDGM